MKFLLFITFFLFTDHLHAQDREFQWMPWYKVPEKVKKDLKKFRVSRELSLYDDIMQHTRNGYTIQLAVNDFNHDRREGYAIAKQGDRCCNDKGCMISVYEDNGAKRIALHDDYTLVKPSKNGIIDSKGQFIRLN